MKKLPLAIDSHIFLRSMEQKGIKAVSRVLGARHGDFILIEQPVFRVTDRFYATPEEFLCMFSDEGDVYHFQSRIQKTIDGGLTFIEYPGEFQVETTRKHHRIQVNIDVFISFQELKEQVKGMMKDISEGGSFVSLPVLIPVVKNTRCSIDLTLPDNQNITGLTALVRQVQFRKLRKTIDMGLEFTGPPSEIEKVRSFCNFCMFFKV
jgi:c-di-GMP-binding flagellar brake protein YcgR